MENSNQNNSATDSTAHQGWQKKSAQFIASQTLSLLGSSIVRYAILWYITLSTNSGKMMTLATLCVFVPQFIISFFSGSWADKFSRKAIIIASDLFTASCSLTLAVLMIFKLDSLWLMLVVCALGSLGAGVQTPAVNAIIPQIVPKDKLISVNGILSGMQPFMAIFAPIIAAAMLDAEIMHFIFAIDVVTALSATILLLFLRLNPVAETNKEDVSLKAGVEYMRKQGYIIPLLVFTGLLMLFVTPAAMLTTLHVKREFGDDYFYLMGLEIAFGAGMILGGVLTASILKKLNKSKLTSFSTFFLGTLSIILAFSTFNFYAYCTILFIMGIFVTTYNVPITTLMQENVDDSMLGRVFAIFSMIGACMFPVGMLLFGPLADVVDIKYLLISSGIAISALTIFAMKGSWNKLKQK